ncbi:MAG: hypothetical protein E7L41_15275, partial [Escherichia coli]|nr:hypothetical protein [Escherichia coli]
VKGVAYDQHKYEILVLDGRIFSVDVLLGRTPLDHYSLIPDPAVCFASRFLLFYQFGLLSNRYAMFVLSLIFTLKRIRASQPCH